MLQNNQRITIREAVGKPSVYQSVAPEYRKIFATEKNRNHHYSRDDTGKKRSKSVIAFRKMSQNFDFNGRQERKISKQGPVEEAGWQSPGDEIVQVRR
jgi:hypothetical protein